MLDSVMVCEVEAVVNGIVDVTVDVVVDEALNLIVISTVVYGSHNDTTKNRRPPSAPKNPGTIKPP